MKKVLIMSLAAALLSVDVFAQLNADYLVTKNPADNSFITLGGGATGLWCPGICEDKNNAAFSPSMDFAFGRWLAPAWGGRIGLSGGNMGAYYTPIYTKGAYSPLYYEGIRNDKPYQESSFMYVHFDLMHNWQNLFRLNPDRFYNIMPYVHVGWMFHYGTETAEVERVARAYNMESFAFGAGLINTFRIDRRVNAFLDLRATLQHPADNMDWLKARSMQISAQFGLSFHLGNTEWSESLGYATLSSRYNRSGELDGIICNPRYIDNTFVQILGGFNEGRGWATAFHGAWDLSIGKWFGPYVGGRTGWIGSWRGGKPELSKKSNLNFFHGDLLINVSNLIAVNNARFWTAIPYISCGLANHTGTRHPLGVGCGFLQSFRLGRKFDFNVDARYLVQGRFYREVFVTAGTTYNIGRNGWDESSATILQEREPSRWAVSFNALGLVDASFNADFQYAVNRHWTADAKAILNLNTYGIKDRQNQQQTVSLGARFWPWCVYSGIWIKGYALAGLYHAFGENTIAEDPSVAERGGEYGLGLSAGYSLPLTTHFNLEIGAGIAGGMKSYLQYSDPTFKNCISGQYMNGGFFKLGELSLSAVFVF